MNPDIIGTHGLEKTDTLTLSIKERTGGLPEDWRLSRLRWLGNIFPSNVDKKSHEEEIAVKLCNYVDVYYNDSIDRSIDFMAATATKEEIEKFSLRTGDVIITKDSETPDDIAVPAIVKEVTNGLVCGYHLSLIRVNQDASGRYIFWALKSHQVSSQAHSRAKGITRFAISVLDVKDLWIPIPPKQYQTQIASFLDYETSRIDTLIEKQKRLIELLKEKRQAVISHAVTRGLDPDIPLKDSGVEWLGKVPEHWKRTRLRWVVHVIPSNVDKKSHDSEQAVWLCNYVDVYYHDRIDASIDFMKATASLEEIRKYTLCKGDVILTKDSETADDIAVPALVTLPLPGVVCGYHLSLLRKKLGVEGAFLFWALISDPVAAQFHSRAKGITRYAISVGDVKDVSIPLPPENVQLQIASFLESETTRFDLLIEKQKKAIELLKEKRSALISAAVTGKIDVRDWTPPEKVA